jgi:hypothetical protein
VSPSDDTQHTDNQPDSSDNGASGDGGSVHGAADSGATGASTGAGDTSQVVRDENPDTEGDGERQSTYRPANRASYLRKKARRTELTDSEREWLSEYEANTGRPGKRKKRVGEESAAGSPPPVLEKTGGGSRAPRPPIVHETDNWRNKYKGGNETGRELLCTMIGDQWHRMLVAMESQIAEAGMTPIVEVSNEHTRHMLILAVDDLLPSYIKATPAIVATVKTSALTAQRFAKAKAIKEAHDKQKRAIQVVTRAPQPETPRPTPAVTAVTDDMVARAHREAEERQAEELAAQRAPRINPKGRIVPADHVIR